MKTVFIKSLCLILLILAAGTTDAQDFEVNGIYYNVLSEEEGTVEVTGGNLSGDVVIPAEVSHDGGTYRVTTIGDHAFNSFHALTSVIMPSVTTIGDGAFIYCSALTSVNMPSVTTIGVQAFNSCSALTSVIMPSVTTIGESVFYYCSALTSVSMPSVTTIGDEAFYSCSALRSVDMPSVKTIGNWAFTYCSALASVNIPASVTSIDFNPFVGCELLREITVDDNNPNYTSFDGVLYDKYIETLIACPGGKDYIEIPSSVTTIGESAFGFCTSLESVDMSSATTISSDAFSDCIALTSVSMPSVTTIGEFAFSGCSALTSISMQSVTAMGDYAFSYCSTLASVNIPASVTSIGFNPFIGCELLREITVDDNNPNYTSFDGVLYDKYIETLIACPGGNGSIDMPSSVTTIGDGAFGECSALTSVEMPSVTAIGDSAFYYCDALTSVEMPSVTTIGDYAFMSCSALTSLSMPSVTTIGNNVFSFCHALTSLSMPSVTTIGRVAFYYCSALTSVDIPASVSMIGNDAFSLCNALTSVYCHWEDPLECDPNFYETVLENATLYVPIGTVDAYRSVSPWSEFLNIEEKDYSGIADTHGSEVTVTVIDGAISIEGGDGTASVPVVEVYSAGGQCVYRGTDSSIGGLGHGIYVVKVGGTVQKVAL